MSVLDNPKVQGLPAAIFRAWVNCLCLARTGDGFLPPVDAIAFRLRCSARQAKQWRDELVARKLVDVAPDGTYRIHDWDEHQYISDGSTERVRKHREKLRKAVSETFHETPVERAGNVTVTPPDTEQIQSRTETDSEAPRSAQRPEVSVIRQPERWKTDEVFCRFKGRYVETGAALIDEDFSEAFEFCWKTLDWEQKAGRMKALEDHFGQYAENPRFAPKPLKFLEREWQRPTRPSAKDVRPESAIGRLREAVVGRRQPNGQTA